MRDGLKTEVGQFENCAPATNSKEKQHSSHTKHCAFTKVFFSDSLSFCDFFVLRLLLAIVLNLDLCKSEVSELDFL